jgi:hypothetical protein
VSLLPAPLPGVSLPPRPQKWRRPPAKKPAAADENCAPAPQDDQAPPSTVVVVETKMDYSGTSSAVWLFPTQRNANTFAMALAIDWLFDAYVFWASTNVGAFAAHVPQCIHLRRLQGELVSIKNWNMRQNCLDVLHKDLTGDIALDFECWDAMWWEYFAVNTMGVYPQRAFVFVVAIKHMSPAAYAAHVNYMNTGAETNTNNAAQ